MSIIYDALQKTQKARDNVVVAEAPAKTASPRVVRLDLVLIAIIVIMAIAEIVMHIPHTSIQPLMTAATKAQPSAAAQAPALTQSEQMINTALEDYRDNHTVNGVFMSDKDKLALIDSKPYHVGDDVDGMTIVAINMNSVKLRSADHTVVLKPVA